MIVIGCDPEFVLTRNNHFVPAHELFSSNLESALGCDGASDTGEIRPGCSGNVFDLTGRIMETLSCIDEADSEVRVLAGHFKFNRPIGGHIHFSFPKKVEKKDMFELAGCLDSFLIDCLSDLIDDVWEREARQNFGYGLKAKRSKCAVRINSDTHFEYRAPGSWLLCPKVALTNLAIAKTVVHQKVFSSLRRKHAAPQNEQEKRENLMNLLSRKEKIPKDCWNASEIVEEVINSRLDWSRDIKEAWL